MTKLSTASTAPSFGVAKPMANGRFAASASCWARNMSLE
jgi:hypothetical protein